MAKVAEIQEDETSALKKRTDKLAATVGRIEDVVPLSEHIALASIAASLKRIADMMAADREREK